MEKKNQNLIISICFFVLFIIWTILTATVNVRAIGPMGSEVGFANMNGWFFSMTGHHYTLYVLTDLLSIPSAILGFIFAHTGLIQWIKRKNILKVDSNILAQGIFYTVCFIVFISFQFLKINYRPVMFEDGKLEASYPSSTTMLSLTFLVTAPVQYKYYVKNKKTLKFLTILTMINAIYLIIGRTFSGVHWVSDIIGSVFISIALVEGFFWLNPTLEKALKKQDEKNG